jgi:hypothetical protein
MRRVSRDHLIKRRKKKEKEEKKIMYEWQTEES